MKKIIFLLLTAYLGFNLLAYSSDYLESATAAGSGTTTDNSKVFSDLFSITIDLGGLTTDTKYVLITASINMRPDGASPNGREANYNIYRSDLISDKSGVIKRQILKNTEAGVESWGVGTLVHIFDVSALSGSKTYTLQHSNKGSSEIGRNVYSSARLTAVALSTKIGHYELSNNVKRINDGADDVTTTSSTYAPVTGLTTDAITLPIQGDIYVTASVNGRADGTGSVAEYKLEYSTDNGSSWSDLGKPIKRSMISTWDDGIVSLVGLLQDQDADSDFKFRVAHKRESGTATITTHNSNLCAVALAHSGGGYFQTFYSEVGATGVDTEGLSTAAATVTSTTFKAAADISSTGTNLFLNSQYLVSASNLNEGGVPPQRMRAGNQLIVTGASSETAEEYYRYLPSNDNFGAGGFIGLMEDLVSLGSYSIKMQHQIAALPGTASGSNNETLTTSEVILCGFQTYDDDFDNPLPVTLSSFNANLVNTTPQLIWTTQSEQENLGWNVYRSPSLNFAQGYLLTPDMIDGAGSVSEPTDYVFNDPMGIEGNRIYGYWIESISYTGESELFGPVSLTVPYGIESFGTPIIPEMYGLKQNHPNPFNPNTKISFSVENTCQCEISIFDIKGRKLVTLYNNIAYAEDDNFVTWNGEDHQGNKVSSGIYYYQLQTPQKTEMRKMILIK